MMTITMITTAHGFLEENQLSTKSCSILMTLMFIIKHFLMIEKAHGVQDTHDKICAKDRIRIMMATIIGVPMIR